MDITNIFLHQIAAPGQPGGITPEEAAIIRADQATILARPVVERLLDLLDVAGSPGDGWIIAYDTDTDQWVATPLLQGISRMWGQGGPAEGTAGPFTAINVYDGLRYVANGATVDIKPLYGTSAGTVAAGNHTHELVAAVALPFAATGSLSSGTRPLSSGTVTGLNPGTTYRVTADLRGEVRGEGGGAGRSHPRITIAGNARTRFGGSRGYVRTVAGVDREHTMTHPGVTVSGVTSVAVAADLLHVDGDPKYVGGGELTVHLEANR